MRFSRASSILSFAAALAACSSASHSLGNRDSFESTGRAFVGLQSVPSDVHCVTIAFVGARTETRSIDVTAGDSAVYAFDGLPVGAVSVTGRAYDGGCSAVAASTVPTWIGKPVLATLSSDASTRIDLLLEKNGQAQVGVGFEDDSGAPDASGIDSGFCETDDALCNAPRALYVAPDGDDGAPGTMASPLRSIDLALARAAATPGMVAVFLATGTYAGPVTLANGISLHGGYLRATWRRDGTLRSTIVGGALPDGRVVGVEGLTIDTETFVSELAIQSGAPSGPGGSVYGLVCTACTGLIIGSSSITAVDGAPGASGAAGSAGSDGLSGSGGDQGRADPA